MSDIARLGIEVDTNDLDAAAKKLNALPAAAAGVTSSFNKMAAASEGANNAIAKGATSAAAADVRAAEAALKKLQATQGATSEDKKAAAQAIKTAQATLAAVKAEQARLKSINDIAAGLRKKAIAEKIANPPAPNPAAQPGNPRMPANDQMPNRFNTGNIAAQFQDIGVTASMGMNPLLVAMQQGTQLSAILNSMEKPLTGLGIALKSVFNTVSILSIGIVALVVAGIQMIDWSNAATNSLGALSAGVKYLLPFLVALGIAIAAVKWQSIIAGATTLIGTLPTLATVMNGVGTAAAAMWAFVSAPVTLIVAGITLVVGALLYLSGAFDGISDAIDRYKASLTSVKKYTNDFRKSLTESVDDLLIQQNTFGMTTAKAKLYEAQQKLINKAVNEFNGKPTRDQLDNISAAAERATDVYGLLLNQIEKLESKKAFADLANDTEAQIARMKAELDGLQKYGKGANQTLIEFDLIQKAKNDKKILPEDIDLSKIKAQAAELANYENKISKLQDSMKPQKKTEDEKAQEKYDKVVAGADRKIASLQAERDALGQTAMATAELKFYTDLLNDANQKGIELTPTGTAQLQERAHTMALLTEEIREHKEMLDFAKDATKGFFADMRSGLEQGKSVWQSFGNAVANVLNKIVDKMIDANINNMFGGGSSGGGAAGGILGGLIGGIGNLFGSQGTLSRLSYFGNASMQGPIPMAKGGAFTNGIYNKTTPFAFASGDSFGVMGEAGPEAVMPLHRGPDGSLGVKMTASANDNQSSSNNGDSGNTYYIDARGADQGAVARMEQALLTFAGPGVIERRVMNAQTRGAL